jgi:hypothetical protein
MIIAALAAMANPAIAKRKRSKAAPPPPVALPCLNYAPALVAVRGVLQRETFEKPAIEDLFVNPNDPEVGEPPPAPATLPPPSASLSSLPPSNGTNPPAASPPPSSSSPQSGAKLVAVDAGFIGPMMPADPAVVPTSMVADATLMRARPVRRPRASEQVWVLTMRPDICVDVDPNDRVNTGEKRVRKLQLVIDRSLEPSLRKLQKTRVVVEGQLFHAVSRMHYLPVLINAATVRPPEWIPELTEAQSPQQTSRPEAPLPPIPPLLPLPKSLP